jgi:DNA-binding transcriptional ArsR family regulator
VTTRNGSKSTDDDLLIALRHPLRRRILKAMAQEGRSSPRDLSARLSEPLSNVSYHVRVLVDCNTLELVGTRAVRGSTQHFYRAVVESEWARAVIGMEVTKASNGDLRGEEIG